MVEEGTDRWERNGFVLLNIWFKNKSSPRVMGALAEILFKYSEMKWGRICV